MSYIDMRYFDQAKYLIDLGYVKGTTVDALAQKLYEKKYESNIRPGSRIVFNSKPPKERKDD